MTFDIDRLNLLRKIVLNKGPAAVHTAEPGLPFYGFAPFLNELDKALEVNTSGDYVGARLARLERRVMTRALIRA